MRRSKLDSLVGSDLLRPTKPDAGDGVLGCRHEPNPHAAQAHVYAFEAPLPVKTPGGRVFEFKWLILCAECQAVMVRSEQTVDESLNLAACHGFWPRDNRPLEYMTINKKIH